jgi:hypothetical protein
MIEPNDMIVELQDGPVRKSYFIVAIAYILRTSMGKNHDRVDQQVIIPVEQGEIVEDTPIKPFVIVGLVLNVNDEKCLLSLEFGFDNHIGFQCFAFEKIRKYFQRQELDRVPIEVSRYLRKKEGNEFWKKLAKNFFEQVIVTRINLFSHG